MAAPQLLARVVGAVLKETRMLAFIHAVCDSEAVPHEHGAVTAVKCLLGWFRNVISLHWLKVKPTGLIFSEECW